MILGLSATPFRTDDDEAHRLAGRFDRMWLPKDQEGLHVRLSCDGILASATIEAWDSGFGLLAAEEQRLSELTEGPTDEPAAWEESSALQLLLNQINDRFGLDQDRTEKIASLIEKRPDDERTLLFANSVQHAEYLSLLLNRRGILSAPISGDTPTPTRRHFLAQFNRGELRVLCNHTVLSTGFDTPKTDMILITRQVFSPVRYMQMVGRGLRGPRNGGTERCTILTVKDNFGRFGDRLAYHYCRRFFEAE
ncbi:MAG TPA: helicase-related protein [Fimbriimonadaceae bacterium]|nr:helicase-related protein [Fimbriimonadaceae bacterium]HRJ95841.1 helicase-related protein [Fimbriimonadaceae bacterium]